MLLALEPSRPIIPPIPPNSKRDLFGQRPSLASRVAFGERGGIIKSGIDRNHVAVVLELFRERLR